MGRVMTVLEWAWKQWGPKRKPRPVDREVMLSSFAAQAMDNGASAPFGPPWVGDRIRLREGGEAVIVRVYMKDDRKMVDLRSETGRMGTVPADKLHPRIDPA
jgi:hypothetical protein